MPMPVVQRGSLPSSLPVAHSTSQTAKGPAFSSTLNCLHLGSLPRPRSRWPARVPHVDTIRITFEIKQIVLFTAYVKHYLHYVHYVHSTRPGARGHRKRQDRGHVGLDPRRVAHLAVTRSRRHSRFHVAGSVPGLNWFVFLRAITATAFRDHGRPVFVTSPSAFNR